jgi:hypothetical protein
MDGNSESRATEAAAVAVDDAGALVQKVKERNLVAFAQLMMCSLQKWP